MKNLTETPYSHQVLETFRIPQFNFSPHENVDTTNPVSPDTAHNNLHQEGWNLFTAVTNFLF